MIAWGWSRLEHENRLEQVLKNISKAGLKLNKDNCMFSEKQTAFMAHTVSGDGIKADSAKVSKVRDMPIPQKKKELQSFIGMVT